MLAVVKEPHIELFLGGKESEVDEFLSFVRNRYTVEILSPQESESEEDDDEAVDITTTDWWKENATPGHFLAGHRLQHELTQKQLSEKCGISSTSLSAYENDKRKITRRAAIRIANALGEDPEQFCVWLNVE